MTDEGIRPECLATAASGQWEQPTGEEIKTKLRLAGLTGAQAAKYLGLGNGGDRTVRRWTGGEVSITYAAWALLCHRAGLGEIWVSSAEDRE